MSCANIFSIYLNAAGPRSSLLTLAAGALAAVNDGQDDGLALAALTTQAQETNGGVRIQAVTTALAERAEVRLLSGEREGG